MIEAAEDGWWYAAGLPHGRVAVSFAAEPETVRELMLAAEERWLARLLRTQHIASRLDQCDFLRGSLVIRAAPSFRLDPAAGARWLAVGDAAAAYDPLCSQGIHKALADGIEAADAIAAALASDSDIVPTYTVAIVDAFEEHRAICHHFYQLERRWPGSPFWQRRIERTAPNGRAPAQNKSQFTVEVKADTVHP
jgi:flavin-dependent dehydrogenase